MKQKIFTQDEVAQIKALAGYLTIEQIAGYFGLSYSTFNKHRQSDSRIDQAIIQGRSRCIADIAGNIVQQARDGSFNAAKFYLSTQAGWKETNKVEVETAPKRTLDDFYR